MKLKPIKYPKRIRYIEVKRYNRFRLDKKSFLLIRIKSGNIEVGICNYENRLVCAYRGKNVKALYKKIIDDGWITELKHAAYLGMEVQKAEYAIKNRIKYVQASA